MTTKEWTFADAQRDMRQAYYGGAPGVLVSSAIWAVAAGVAAFHSPMASVWALFIGGMLIHPVGVVVGKLLGSSEAHTKGNPLGMLAGTGTVWMLLMLPVAYVVARHRIEWFFPAMLFVIGGRYMTFQTLYGSWHYLACGIALAAAGWLLILASAPPAVGALTGSLVEAAFGIAILVHHRGSRGRPPHVGSG